jgi:hypothetical protein
VSIFDDITDATDSVLSFVLSPVRSLVRKGLHVVAGWALNIFHLVGRGWDDMVSGANNLIHGVTDFYHATYRGFVHLFKVTIPGVIHWTEGHLAHLAASLEHAAASLAHAIAHEAVKAWNDLMDGLSWLQHHVIDPIEHRLASAEHFLAHEVHDAVDLITHPTRLFEWIWQGMLAAVPDLARDLTAPTVRWFRHSAAPDAVEVAHGIESVLVALL